MRHALVTAFIVIGAALTVPAVRAYDLGFPGVNPNTIWRFNSDPAPIPVAVHVLAGQSNMDGRAAWSDLQPAPQLEGHDHVLLIGAWALDWKTIGPGLTQAGAPDDAFGPEVGYGLVLAEALSVTPADDRAVVLKHAVGGTSLAREWGPGGSARERLLRGLRKTVAYLQRTGYDPTVSAFVWAQGETDAARAADAQAYAANLRDLIETFRAETGDGQLPVIVARTRAPNAPHESVVQAAQAEVCSRDPHATFVDTSGLQHFDGLHYDAESLLRLGEVLAGWAPR